MQKLFKSTQGKEDVLELYDEKLHSLNIAYSTKSISTSFGETHLIIIGDASKPPLMIIHGSNGCAPISLETYPNLTKKYQVFAIDVLAQPNKSAENRLNMSNDEYGQWINEVLNKLGLQDVVLIGFSFGGLVILKTLINDESRIKEVFLAAPAYIVNGNPLKALWKMFIPMRIYMRTQKDKYLKKFLNELFTEPDAFALNYLSKVFIHFEMDFTPVPVISKVEASKIKTPITLIAAKHDLVFPGEKMIKRARKIFPALNKTVLLPHSKHVQNRADNTLIEELVLANN